MTTIGITGNICSGKTSVCASLAQQGAQILEYDAFVRNAYENPHCIREIVNTFGSRVLEDKKIDRTLLKKHLKQNPHEIESLWKITDKYVDELVEKALERNKKKLFFECAPLYEKKWDRFCSSVIACYVPDTLRVKRLIQRARIRDGFTLLEAEAIQVLSRQKISQEEKIRRADYVIDNSGSFEDLEREVIKLYQMVRK